MHPEPDARPDLIEALLQSCWTVESGRAVVLAKWSGEFADEATGAEKRANLLREVLAERGIEPPDHVVGPFAYWLESVCGETPTTVPLGPGLVNRLATWTDVYATPYLGSRAEEFRTLGEAEIRLPIHPRPLREEEAAIPHLEPPPGRRFVVFTDIHIGASGCEELARRAVQEINALEPEFVLIPGDITEDGEPEQFQTAKDVLDGLDVPYYAVLGNHDAVQRSTREAAGVRLYTEAFGHEPVDRVIECGDLQVALLDSTDPTPSPFPDWDLNQGGFREDAGGTNNGALRDGQAEALVARLDPQRPTLLVLHHELQPFAGFPPVMFGMLDDHSQTLLDTLGGQHLVGVVAGHTHRSAVTEVGDGVLHLEVPALKDWPFTYSIVGVQSERVHVVVRQLGDPELVWKRAEHVPPIYLNYVTGPLSSLHHVFEI